MIEFFAAEVAAYYSVRAPGINQSRAAWRGPCPIHYGKRDSFAVDSETGLWYCHSECNRGGDILALEMELTDADFTLAKVEVFRLLGRAQWR